MGLNGQHSKNTGCGTTNRQPNRPLQGDRSKVVAERVTSTDAAEQNCTAWNLGLYRTEAQMGLEKATQGKNMPCHPAVAMEKQKMGLLRKNCPHCRGKLETGQRIHVSCIDGYADAQQAKKERADAKAARMAAKVERARIKARKEADKDIPDLIKEADKAFCAFIRERDRQAGFPCISSGNPLRWSAGNQVDAGHYRSRGAASHLRYNEDNCHAQSKRENRFRAGNAVEYRIKLIQRIGLERVEALEADNTPHKWTREELIAIRDTYRAKFKALKSNSKPEGQA